MESIDLMARQIEEEKPVEEQIPAEIEGLLDAVKMLTDKVNDLVATYAVQAAAPETEEVEVVEEEEEETRDES